MSTFRCRRDLGVTGMHTFFINTSKKSLEDYAGLFDIHMENRTLVTIDCPMADWYHKERGYESCVRKMCDLIDGYVEINDVFNLILYIDLSEQKAYASLPRDVMNDIKRNEYLRAMRTLFTHVISDSIVRDLEAGGRKPQDVLVMFGEDRRYVDRDGEQHEATVRAVEEKLYELLGLPEDADVVNTAKAVHDGKQTDKVAAFAEEIAKVCTESFIPGIRESYRESMELWYGEVINDRDVPKARAALIHRVTEQEKTQISRFGIRILSCPYDFFASTTNKKVHALSCLNIALHLMKCVKANTIYTRQSQGQHQRTLMPFREYTPKEIVEPLKKKQWDYEESVRQIGSLEKSYPELGLAPQLPVFNHGKFGLDEFGEKAVSLIITDAEETKPDAQEEPQTEEIIRVEGNGKQVEVVVKTGQSLFTQQEYQLFDYHGSYAADGLLKKNSTPEQYISQALELRKHHINYLKKLKVHVTKVLSNYAGKSKENKAALLGVGGFEYELPGEGDQRSRDMRSLELVEPVAQTAYRTTLDQYMKFCAGRSVAITDIEAQCDWYVSRVNQVSECLHKLKLVALGLFGVIIAAYIPYVAIQFEAITANFTTLLAALGSIAVPILLLYAGFVGLAVAQKKKYLKAGQELIDRSNQIICENELAARKFDQLLTAAIPALRWVYEYKLDAQYCSDCCSIADAKIEHHRKKMLNRIAVIKNIISDLDYREEDEDFVPNKIGQLQDAVDYEHPFCVGKKNIAFYTIADEKLLEDERGEE